MSTNNLMKDSSCNFYIYNIQTVLQVRLIFCFSSLITEFIHNYLNHIHFKVWQFVAF